MARDKLIAWLNDAYSMEQGLVSIFEKSSQEHRHERSRQ